VGQEDLRGGDQLGPAGVVLAHPRLVVGRPVDQLDSLTPTATSWGIPEAALVWLFTYRKFRPRVRGREP
jgi:hypothetical protein